MTKAREDIKKEAYKKEAYKIIAEFLPRNASKTISERLLQKGKKYSIDYIRNSLAKRATNLNNDIILCALELCEEEMNKVISMQQITDKITEKSI